MTIILIIDAVVAGLLLVMLWRLIYALRLFRIKKTYTAAVNAPSVSVCIPARNEVHAMTECLERVLASDYEKMEIVVFDDSSSDDTSVLVRSFAHAGVRFVPGVKLPDGWLGKNYALDILAQEASGSIIIFLDVDTHIRPTTISQLVSYMLTEKVDMVSVVPRREDAYRASVLFGHLRYFWELLFSTRRAPAAASSFWMISRDKLAHIGGFERVRTSVAPESALAQLLGTVRYHCLISSRNLGVAYEKKWHSQLETGRRLLLPKVDGHWFGSWLAFLGLLLLNIPTFIVLSALFVEWTLLHGFGLGLVVLGMITYGIYTSKLWGKGWWLGALLWPVVIFQELLVFIASAWGYTRHTVTWKGRPVASIVRADKIEID
jgi:glycosyltransferase involved in cell wall biosynthesis